MADDKETVRGTEKRGTGTPARAAVTELEILGGRGRIRIQARITRRIEGDEVVITPSRGSQKARPEAKRPSQQSKDATRATAPSNRGPDVGKSKPSDVDIWRAIPSAPPEKPPEEPPAMPPDKDSPGGDVGERMLAEARRRQEEARGIANRFAKGEKVTAREAGRAITRLLEAGRAGALIGEDVKISDLINDLHDIQSSQVNEAIEDALRQGEGSGKGYRRYLSENADSLERLYALLGEESRGGLDLTQNLRELERSQIVNKARDILDRAKNGEGFGSIFIRYIQQQLVQAERAVQLLGQGTGDSEGATMGLVKALANVPRVSLTEEATDVLDRSRRGQRFDDEYVDLLRQSLIEADKVGGPNSQGRELAQVLSAMEAWQIEADVRTTLAQAKNGKAFTELYLTYLLQRVKKLDAKDEGSGRKSEWRNLESALDDLIGRKSATASR